jgi:hypothetical protein
VTAEGSFEALQNKVQNPKPASPYIFSLFLLYPTSTKSLLIYTGNG